MYAGRIVERGTVQQVFNRPQHPYTVGLLGATPRGGDRKARLASIEGNVPDLRRLPPSCRLRGPLPVCRGAVHDDRTAAARNRAPASSACLRAPLEQIP